MGDWEEYSSSAPMLIWRLEFGDKEGSAIEIHHGWQGVKLELENWSQNRKTSSWKLTSLEVSIVWRWIS